MKKLRIQEIKRIDPQEFKLAHKIPLTIILDNIRSSHNVGAFFRTADAFRVEKIYLCGITAQPPSNEIRKTALGATESVDWEYFDNTVEAVNKLKHQDYKIFGIEQIDSPIFLENLTLDIEKPVALIFGNEVKGVQQNVIDLCDACIEIPQFGTKHSLNVSVSGGIVIWEVFNKLKKSL